MLVKSVDNFIGQSHKPINITNGRAQVAVQEPNGRRKGSTVATGHYRTALLAGLMKKLDHA